MNVGIGRKMTLAQLLFPLHGQVEIVEQLGLIGQTVTSITDDSRAVTPGAVFVAVKGEQADGHVFVKQAIQAGAVAVVAEKRVETGMVPLVRVDDSRMALGLMGSCFYGDPSAQMMMVGITGTNGKTTSSYLAKALLEETSRRVGLIGTVAYQIGQESIPASHTTPDALE